MFGDVLADFVLEIQCPYCNVLFEFNTREEERKYYRCKCRHWKPERLSNKRMIWLNDYKTPYKFKISKKQPIYIINGKVQTPAFVFR